MSTLRLPPCALCLRPINVTSDHTQAPLFVVEAMQWFHRWCREWWRGGTGEKEG